MKKKYGLTPEAVRRIVGIFAEHVNIDEVVLYGSRAKGDYKPGSDIDLTIKGEGVDLEQLNKISNDLDDLLLPNTFDLSVFLHIKNLDLVNHIARVGKVLYKRGGNL